MNMLFRAIRRRILPSYGLVTLKMISGGRVKYMRRAVVLQDGGVPYMDICDEFKERHGVVPTVLSFMPIRKEDYERLTGKKKEDRRCEEV